MPDLGHYPQIEQPNAIAEAITTLIGGQDDPAVRRGDRELPVASADEAFDESGALAEPDLSLELGNILIELVELAERRRIAA